MIRNRQVPNLVGSTDNVKHNWSTGESAVLFWLCLESLITHQPALVSMSSLPGPLPGKDLLLSEPGRSGLGRKLPSTQTYPAGFASVWSWWVG